MNKIVTSNAPLNLTSDSFLSDLKLIKKMNIKKILN